MQTTSHAKNFWEKYKNVGYISTSYNSYMMASSGECEMFAFCRGNGNSKEQMI